MSPPRQQEWEIGRDQTDRLVRSIEIRGVRRGNREFTRTSDPAGKRPTDLVKRRFRTHAPCTPWVVEATYERTWRRFAYVAFVTDVFSLRIVGWNVALTLEVDILLFQALDMAAFDVGGNLTGLDLHSDYGSNYTAMVHTDRIAELGAIPLTGTDGDSCDNAIAESVNALHKTELI